MTRSRAASGVLPDEKQSYARGRGRRDGPAEMMRGKTGGARRWLRQLYVVGLGVTWLAAGSAQAPRAVSNLALRLQPEALEEGVPQAFRFELVNTTDHDVRVPRPAIQCENSFSGSIALTLEFHPLEPGGPSGPGRGCAGDRMDWPAILIRISEWEVLHPGERLSLNADRAHLFYETGQAGSYEFWAAYLPPTITAEEKAILRQAGIDFPQDRLTTPHIIFRKNP
jgi:hypothetical protein